MTTARALALAVSCAALALAGCGDGRRASADDDLPAAASPAPSGERFRPPMRTDGPPPAASASVVEGAAGRPAATASAAGLPNGRYRCDIWLGGGLATLGFVDILDGGYRGPSNDPTGGYTPLSVDAAGRMAWSPTFSQLAATGGVITRSTVSGTPSAPGFTVEYTTGRGNLESLDCTRI